MYIFVFRYLTAFLFVSIVFYVCGQRCALHMNANNEAADERLTAIWELMKTKK